MRRMASGAAARALRSCLIALLIVAAGVACPDHAWAQAVEGFEVVARGEDAIVQVLFAYDVQLRRSVAAGSGSLVQVEYELVGARPREWPRQTTSRRFGARDGLPDLFVEDRAGQGVAARTLVAGVRSPRQIQARTGPTPRVLEIVLPGAGAAVRKAQVGGASRPPAGASADAARAPPDTGARARPTYAIVVSRSTDRVESLPPVPAALQEYEVSTRNRVVDGATVQELVVGPFATRAAAEAASRHLARFPRREIVSSAAADEPPASAAAPTQPPKDAATKPASGPAKPATGTAGGAGAPPMAPAAVEAKALGLLDIARAATAGGDHALALDTVNEVLNLPPNSHSPQAQEMAGLARLALGDPRRAKLEFELYLELYPNGAEAARVREQLARLDGAAPPAAPGGGTASRAGPAGPGPGGAGVSAQAPDDAARPKRETSVNGSASVYYFGGNGKVRSQDFQDSPLSGLPEIAGDPQLSSEKSRQVYTDLDASYRSRDADGEVRLGFRDAYINDLERASRSRNRLSAAYVDYKSFVDHYDVRVGRQSPRGGGVVGRFDGVRAGYNPTRNLRLGAVAGEPADRLFDSRRRFYGASVDADSLLPNVGAGVYAIQQTIDGETDRRAVGLEMRYFAGGASVFSQFDYDTVIGGLNIASVQANWVGEDGTSANAMYDRRALTMLALGNSLTFLDPVDPILATTIQDKLRTNTIEALRHDVKATTPYVTQASLGLTKPVSESFKLSGNAQLTNIGAIPAVPGVLGFEQGREATGDTHTYSLSVIGLNLLAARDTHVLTVSVISGPTLDGYLLSYNNSTFVSQAWQFEPSLQYFRNTLTGGTNSERWSPGLRLTYRAMKRLTLETSANLEFGNGHRVDPLDFTRTTEESSRRAYYSVGLRYEF
ncbi:MAG: hypothetical protein AB7P21_25575 [Lautropia sp.]